MCRKTTAIFLYTYFKLRLENSIDFMLFNSYRKPYDKTLPDTLTRKKT